MFDVIYVHSAAAKGRLSDLAMAKILRLVVVAV